MTSDENDRPSSGPARLNLPGEASLKARQKVIGAGLKRLFDDVVDEDIPDDFADLLAKFDDTPNSGGGR